MMSRHDIFLNLILFPTMTLIPIGCPNPKQLAACVTFAQANAVLLILL